MNIEDALRAAMVARRSVTLSYDGGARRTVNPHALYRTATGETCLDGYQMDGPTTSGHKLPGWRQFDLARISGLAALEKRFQPAAGFNPHSAKYAHGLLAAVRP